jgi:hypothetical protein
MLFFFAIDVAARRRCTGKKISSATGRCSRNSSQEFTRHAWVRLAGRSVEPMHRNALPATELFRIRPNRVIVLGSEVEVCSPSLQVGAWAAEGPARARLSIDAS